MKAQTASRLAWSIGIISIALMLGQLVVMFIDRNIALPNNTITASTIWNFADVLNALVNIAATGFGILLASRQPRNPIGWLFLAAGFALGFSGFGAVYGLHALVADPGSLPAGRAAAWVSNWTGLIPLGVLCFLFLLFPTGHLRSTKWRWAAWYVGGAFTIATAFFLVFSTMTWNDPYSQSSSSGSSGIPGLNRIPYVGGIFGSKTYSHDRSELILFMTPHVIYDTNDLLEASQELKARVRKLRKYITE